MLENMQNFQKGWLHTVRKKTTRLSTRITASLGLISLTRDEEFERHYESFKQLERTLRIFIKNISAFVEHYESFLLALQQTSDNLCEFYREKPQNQVELAELKRKNKALQCEHFHAFKRTIDRQVISVCSQLLQKFTGPHQLISKRSAKLIDFDTKSKEMESCRDIDKKARLREQYVIAKDLYDRLNGQLIQCLPMFNQFALDIFRECILVMLESRKNLILAYTKQTENLLGTPLMASYTASDVASCIMMSCNGQVTKASHRDKLEGKIPAMSEFNNTCAPPDIYEVGKLTGNRQSGASSSQPSGSSGNIPSSDDTSAARPHSAMSQLSSDIDHVTEMIPREISSTPLSNASLGNDVAQMNGQSLDEPDGPNGQVDHQVRINISRISNGSSDSRYHESVESRMASGETSPRDVVTSPSPSPKPQVLADSDLDENMLKQLRSHLSSNDNKSKKRNKKSNYPIYIASWPFVATGPNQLTILSNQELKLIKECDECGNADWSLVRDKKGQSGYVPSSYIVKRD